LLLSWFSSLSLPEFLPDFHDLYFIINQTTAS